MRLTQLVSKERLEERIDEACDDIAAIKVLNPTIDPKTYETIFISDAVWDLLSELDTEDIGIPDQEEETDDGQEVF